MMHQALETWMQAGRPEPVPEELSEHLEDCDSCRMAMAEADETRGWFAEDDYSLSPEQMDSMRFRLQAEARQRGSTRVARTGRSQLGWLAAAAILLAAGGGLLLARSGAPAASTAVTALGQVDAAPGTSIQRIERPPHEVYRLYEGSAWFTVQRLSPDQQFRVVVGDDLVVVRGTRFRVKATSGLLTGVEVEHGHVVVHLATGRSIDLVAGDSWTRPRGPVEVEPEAEVEEAETDAPSARPTRRPRPKAHAPTKPTPDKTAADETPEDETPVVNARFHGAWQLLRSKRFDAAAYAFDQLLSEHPQSSRAADLLFWSGEAHLQAGHESQARARFQELLRAHPDAWHAESAQRVLRELDAEALEAIEPPEEPPAAAPPQSVQ